MNEQQRQTIWSCEVCGLVVDEKECRSRMIMRWTIMNHVVGRHKKEMMQRQEERRKWQQYTCRNARTRKGELGHPRSGMTLLGTTRPVEARKLQEGTYAWRCPYCGLGLPELGRWTQTLSVHLHVARDHPERSGNLYRVWRDVVTRYPEIWRAKLKEARERKAEMWAQKFEEVVARANRTYGPKGHEIISMGIRVKGSTATWLVCKHCRRDTRELAKRERRETRTPLCVPVLTERQVDGAKFIPTMLTWKRWTKTRPQDHL